EGLLSLHRLSLRPRIRRAAAAENTDGIHAIGEETQRPQQPRRKDGSLHFAVLVAVPHLDDIIAADRALELLRRSGPLFGKYVVARHDTVWWERSRALRTCAKVHGCDLGWRPDLSPLDECEPRLFGQ